VNRKQLNTIEIDGTVKFYQYVQACQRLSGAKNILDFGAGRGAALLEARERGLSYKEFLHDLRSLGAHVTACDIDPIVHEHPAADQTVVLDTDEQLNFDDASFDLIVSDNTFEHIEKPDLIAAELLRVLRPGGYICIRTPNRFGYVAIVAAALPPRVYSFVLRMAQPGRAGQDKFKVFYKLNDFGSLRRHFSGADVLVTYPKLEPAYYFGSSVIRYAFTCLHAILPKRLRPAIFVTIYKQA
jgi:SAM-dependent methyltransferase